MATTGKLSNNTKAALNSSAEPRAQNFEDLVLRHIRYSIARDSTQLCEADWYKAVSLAVRDLIVERMIAAQSAFDRADAKREYYLSMEFLVGRSLDNNLANLELTQQCRAMLGRRGIDLDRILEYEPDPALGNGGLGRLAACFLDSMASLGIAGYGYGINYEFGLFKQEIDNGYQLEQPDQWEPAYSPWLIARPEEACLVPLYGRIERSVDRAGNYNPMWLDWRVIIGVPHDLPIVGYGGRTVNVLRLYSARASDHFDIRIFNEGDYFKAVEQKIVSETISKVLYPSDSMAAGRELRLQQEYFFVACAIRDIVHQYLRLHKGFGAFADKVAIQLNDTHPTLAIAELMRLLVDEYDLNWEDAWRTTQATCAYTNHTLMPEALERWPVEMIERVLPRHLEIIYEINRRFLAEAAAVSLYDDEQIRGMSLIEEGPERQVRMAHPAIVGSHSVNGVSELHSELVRTRLVPDFARMWPDRFNNKTNGVTQRRWLLEANPGLAQLISANIGTGWITDLDQLRELENCARDSGFLDEFAAVKHANKAALAAHIEKVSRVSVDPKSLFDVQAKRIHEYKRQLLLALAIINDYLAIVEDGQMPKVARTHIFAGKAAPGYWAARMIIKLLNSLAGAINHDPATRGMLKIAFVPDYKVSVAQKVVAAADLSEQISTAGTEASGTGNMKFAMNGTLTIGTLDGANIEILQEVGKDNIYIFGLTASEIEDLNQSRDYHPRAIYQRDSRVRRVLDALADDRFCAADPGLFKWIYDSLPSSDLYFHLADFSSYLAAREQVWRDYSDRRVWLEKTVLNVARMGRFSSDRTIAEYATEIWGIKPGIPVVTDEPDQPGKRPLIL
jgi:starch phosphorylase